MHGVKVRPDIMRKINFHRYRERMHLSYKEATQEPLEAIELAFLIWSNEDKRDKLKARQAENE